MTPDLCTNPAMRNSWFAVALDAQVGPYPLPVTLLGTAVVLFRAADGTVAALVDRCSHRESPLSPGAIVDGCVVCPYHGWRFDGRGHCVDIPSSAPGVPTPPRADVTAFSCAVRYGLVWVCLGEPSTRIPEMPWDADPAYRRINMPVERWSVSAPRMTDNFLDITHFPFVHVGTFGTDQDTVVPQIELRALDEDFHGYSYEVVVENSAVGTVASASDTPTVARSMSTGFNLPLTVRSTIRYESGLDHVLLLLSTPVDEVHSLFTFVVWRNDDFSVPAEEVTRLDVAIGAEDKAMLERLSGPMPLDKTALVSVQADKCSVEWRRRLFEMLTAASD